MKAYEAEKARVEEENKKAKEKYEADLKVWQAQEAERKKKEQQSRWGGYDSQISSLQSQIESAKKQVESLSSRDYTTFGAMSYKTDANLSRLRSLQRDLHNEQVRYKSYGDDRFGQRSAKIKSLKSQIEIYASKVRDKGQRLAKSNAIRNKGYEIKELQRKLSKAQERKAGAVAEYQAKQKRESQAKSAITSAGTEYAYKQAIWQYRNTDFVSSRGLTKPYMTKAVSNALALDRKSTR